MPIIVTLEHHRVYYFENKEYGNKGRVILPANYFVNMREMFKLTRIALVYRAFLRKGLHLDFHVIMHTTYMYKSGPIWGEAGCTVGCG